MAEEENKRAVQDILDLTDPSLLDEMDKINQQVREAEEADPNATPDEAAEEYLPEAAIVEQEEQAD